MRYQPGMKKRILLRLLLTFPLYLYNLYLIPLRAQENIFTAGFQYRPIFPNTFISKNPEPILVNNFGVKVAQKNGYSAGMLIRRGFTKQFSLEAGINYTKRNFDLTLTDTGFNSTSDFMIIGYEIPVQGIIFLRLADKLYAGTTLGVSMDMYPSNVATHDEYFRHYSVRNGVFQFGALANLGAEYRTEKSGYFYIGASYHLPFTYFYLTSVQYQPTKDIGRVKLAGSYFSLDFRYYFHEDPLKPKKKKKKDK